MKKIIFLISLIFLMISCENEKNPIAVSNGFKISTQETTTNFVLKPQDNSNTVLTFLWTSADNGVNSSESNYILEFAKSGTNFANPLKANLDNYILNDKKYVLKVLELNNLLTSTTDFQCGISYDVDFRIKAILGTRNGNPFVQYSSNIITSKVTPYSNNKLKLAFVQGASSPANSAIIESSSVTSLTDFEGYVFLQAGSYKFYQPNSCGDFTNSIILGGSGGNLSATGATIVVPTTGHYLVKANLVTNTYSINEFTSIALNGKATRGGGTLFAKYVPLTYDATSKKWSAIVELLDGREFKFGAIKWAGALTTSTLPNMPQPSYINTSTVVSYLGKGSKPDALIETTSITGDLKSPGAPSTTVFTKYLITVDLSSSQSYTYTLTPQ